MDNKEIQRKYEEFARWYDFGEAMTEFLAVRRLRQRLLQQAYGRVLEIAAGTGKNLGYYPRTCRITAVDLSPAMLRLARKRAVRLNLDVDFLRRNGVTAIRVGERTGDRPGAARSAHAHFIIAVAISFL